MCIGLKPAIKPTTPHNHQSAIHTTSSLPPINKSAIHPVHCFFMPCAQPRQPPGPNRIDRSINEASPLPSYLLLVVVEQLRVLPLPVPRRVPPGRALPFAEAEALGW